MCILYLIFCNIFCIRIKLFFNCYFLPDIATTWLPATVIYFAFYFDFIIYPSHFPLCFYHLKFIYVCAYVYVHGGWVFTNPFYLTIAVIDKFMYTFSDLLTIYFDVSSCCQLH